MWQLSIRLALALPVLSRLSDKATLAAPVPPNPKIELSQATGAHQ